MRETKFTRLDWLWLLALVALSFQPRLMLLQASNWVIDADEAIVGLMAKHIANGADWPIFYYGQHYLGSLEAILTAGVFKIFGQSNITLHFVPLLFSGIFVAQIFRLGFKVGGPMVARMAGLFAAMPASSLVLWSVKARGGFIELLVIGNWALLITLDLLARKRIDAGRVFGLGLVLGLGWWVNNQIVFYMFAIGLALAVKLFCDSGVGQMLKGAVWGVAGFVLGGWPFWQANFFSEPRFATFAEVGGRATRQQALEYLGGFFTEALPIILGARRFWSTLDVFTSATVFASLVYGMLAVVFVFTVWRQTHVRNLLILFLLGVPLIFSLSKFGWLSIAPRYLLPIYSVLFVAMAVGLVAVARLSNLLATVLLVAVVGLSLAGNYSTGLVIPGEPFVFAEDRVARDQQFLYDWLREHRYSHVHTNYWIGYRMAFETDEQITFSVFGEPGTIRIPEYEDRSAEELERFTAYVLVPSQAVRQQNELGALGYEFRRNEVGPYVVLDNIVPPPAKEKLRMIPVSSGQLQVSHRPEWLGRLTDDDLGTRWGSGAPQSPDMELTVNFPTAELVSRVSLVMGFWRHDYPRHLLIEGQNSKDGTWCVLVEFEPVAPEERYAYSFPATSLKALRLRQLGSEQIFDWSMAELRLYGPVAKGRAGKNLPRLK